MMKSYDVVIVGAGIAGLYYAYQRVHRDDKHEGGVPRLREKIVIVERSNRIGGRVCTFDFAGMRVIGGAGVGRLTKDILLQHLLAQLGLADKAKVMENAKVYYDDSLSQYANQFPAHLRQLQRAALVMYSKRNKYTFREFATRVFKSNKTYDEFVKVSGYTDYENADFVDTVWHYGFDDVYNSDGRLNFSVPWDALVDTLVDDLKSCGVEIYTECPAVSVTSVSGSTLDAITTSSRGTFHARTSLVLACPPSAVLSMCSNTTVLGVFEQTRKLEAWKQFVFNLGQVRSQPFLRMYVRVDEPYVEEVANAIRGYTVVSTVLQKILPIDKTKGVYMASYSDNDRALALQHVSGTQSDFSRLFCQSCNIPLRDDVIKEAKQVFWNEGTHYYAPLQLSADRSAFVRSVQKPLGTSRFVLVGEAYSEFNQGWTEGALQSVQAVMSDSAAATTNPTRLRRGAESTRSRR